MYIGLHVKCPLYLPAFNKTRIFCTDFRTIHRYQISWKSGQWELSCSMPTDGRMGLRDETISLFTQFCERAQNVLVSTRKNTFS